MNSRVGEWVAVFAPHNGASKCVVVPGRKQRRENDTNRGRVLGLSDKVK